ncbi:MAG TPA: hypothetical protein VIM86_10810, partial [Thermodesulfobacteriota bacterium]
LAGPLDRPGVRVLDEPDGLFAQTTSLTAGESALALGPGTDVGRYLLVLEGSLVHEGRSLGAWSCVFVEPGEVRDAPTAGPGGAVVLELGFPRERA